MRKKIITLDELEQEVQKARQQKQIVVSTSGCFDVLHAGHVTYLAEAKAKGDILDQNTDKSEFCEQNLFGEHYSKSITSFKK